MWAIEDFLCQSYGCKGCDHELKKDVEVGKDESWFQNLFDKNKKLGSGGFATVFQARHSICHIFQRKNFQNKYTFLI